MASAQTGQKTSIKWIILSVALATFMAKLDTYIVNISLPSIARWFHASTSVVAFVMLAYLLATVCTLLLFGKLGDRIGAKKVFMWGYALFT